MFGRRQHPRTGRTIRNDLALNQNILSRIVEGGNSRLIVVRGVLVGDRQNRYADRREHGADNDANLCLLRFENRRRRTI